VSEIYTTLDHLLSRVRTKYVCQAQCRNGLVGRNGSAQTCGPLDAGDEVRVDAQRGAVQRHDRDRDPDARHRGTLDGVTDVTTTAAPNSSPLLELPGAVPAGGTDAGVALHYGDPIAEQRALERGAGWVDRSHRGVVAIPGADRLSWLHSITSQHLAALPDGRGTEALVLSPHGHVEHHLLVAETGGTTWLDVEPKTAADLLRYLEQMRFLLRVEPRDATAELAVLSVVGPDTTALLRAAGLAAPAEPYGVAPLTDARGVPAAGSAGFVRRMPWPGAAAADLLVPRPELAEYADRLRAAGASAAGMWAFEALRVAARRPRLGHETDHRTIPHEVGWIGVAVHLDKGCYRGQETVARVHNLGRPPRRLVLLHLSGESEQLPPAGTPVTQDGRPVGFSGTAVRHHELGQIALALVKRATPDDARLGVAGLPAALD
jgi:tRNA-modifying protein YgfZ